MILEFNHSESSEQYSTTKLICHFNQKPSKSVIELTLKPKVYLFLKTHLSFLQKYNDIDAENKPMNFNMEADESQSTITLSSDAESILTISEYLSDAQELGQKLAIGLEEYAVIKEAYAKFLTDSCCDKLLEKDIPKEKILELITEKLAIESSKTVVHSPLGSPRFLHT